MAFVCEEPERMEAVLSHGLDADESFSSGLGDLKANNKMEPPKILGLVTIEDILELIIND